MMPPAVFFLVKSELPFTQEFFNRSWVRVLRIGGIEDFTTQLSSSDKSNAKNVSRLAANMADIMEIYLFSNNR